MTTKDVLIQARELVAARWAGRSTPCGFGVIRNGSVEACCMVGAVVAIVDPRAISLACLAPSVETEQSEPIALLAECVGVESSPALEHWNDAEGRTLADVLSAFDCAIAKAS